MSEETPIVEATTVPVRRKKRTPLAVAPLERPAEDLLSVIARAVADPRMNVEKMERLLGMHERILAEQRKTAFMAAMSRLQARLPQITKEGRIVVKGTERSRYARIEDIDVAIRPLLAEEGFAFSFDSESGDGKAFKLSAKLSHREGHSETKFLFLPLDSSDYRTPVQSIGSTLSYGKRYLIKMHLNLVERGEDDDGQGGAIPITADQARDLHALIQEVDANKDKFCAYMGVPDIESILARDFAKAVTALESKRRMRK